MQTVSLPGTGQLTSRVGFGCSGLLGGPGASQSLRLLEAAYESGIRHFDVAPMYGYGTAEGVLGRFLRHHADATVTTKYGLLPETRSQAELLLRSLAKRFLYRPGYLRHAPSPLATEGIAHQSKAPFTAQAAEASLHRSLRALQRDHIHLFLLHEASAADLGNDDLLHFLERVKRAGHIGAFGVGSTNGLVPELLQSKSSYCGVVQTEWSIWNKPVDGQERFRVAHRVLQGSSAILQWMRVQPSDTFEGWQKSEPEMEAMLPGLLLQAALAVNPGCIILFSSRSAKRIRNNANATSDMSLAQAGLSLHKTLLREASCHAAGRTVAPHASVAFEPNR